MAEFFVFRKTETCEAENHPLCGCESRSYTKNDLSNYNRGVQATIREVLNISLEHLSKMERGKRKPSINLIVAMACYFHVSTDYLLMGKDCGMEAHHTRIMDVVVPGVDDEGSLPSLILASFSAFAMAASI